MNTIIKFFVGCPLTSELRMHLKESPSWNQACVDPYRTLVEARFQKEDYIGRYFEGAQLELQELKQMEKKVQAHLEHFCPKLNLERLSMVVFPQIFLP